MDLVHLGGLFKILLAISWACHCGQMFCVCFLDSLLILLFSDLFPISILKTWINFMNNPFPWFTYGIIIIIIQLWVTKSFNYPITKYISIKKIIYVIMKFCVGKILGNQQ